MSRIAKKRLSFDGLESRSLLTVSATLSAGSLLVAGSATLPGDTIRVVGQPSLTTVYDGASVVGSYAVTKDLSVQLGNVNDNLVIDYSQGRTIGNLSIALGDGANTALISGGRASAASITAGAGNDQVTLTGFAVSNLTSSDTGGGTDSFTLGTSVNLRDLTVLNAEAVDLALASIGGNVTVTDLAIPSAVTTGATIGGGLTVRGVGGSLQVGGTVRGNLLYGNSPSPVTGSNLTVAGRIGGSLYSTGTAFNDTVSFTAGSNVGQDVTISLYGGDDSTTLAGSIGNGHTSIMQLDMGAGNDSVTVASTAQMNSGSTYIWLGAGDDAFSVADAAVFLSARVDGGLGTDSYTGNPNHAGLLVLNFENFL